MHGDNCEDFVVGAPYAGSDRKGAVFIFRGSSSFDFNEAPQVITAETFNVGPGFGYAISSDLIDIDSNGFNDFAVGAPFGNAPAAVVLRSKAVVQLNVDSKLALVELGGNPLVNPDVQSKSSGSKYIHTY